MTARPAEPAHNNEEDLLNNGAGSAGRAQRSLDFSAPLLCESCARDREWPECIPASGMCPSRECSNFEAKP